MKNWTVPALQGYTDGGCHGNPGIGGWAWALFDGDKLELDSDGVAIADWGNNPYTTNSVQEMTAMLELLMFIFRSETKVDIVYSDSNMLVKGINEWRFGWKAKGWKKSGNKPLTNRELWMSIDSVINLLGSDMPKVQWVKAHDTSAGNIYVDRLNQMAIAELEFKNF